MTSRSSSAVRLAAVLLVLVAMISYVTSLDCFVCSSSVECAESPVLESCSTDVVDRTSKHFHFLEKAQKQSISEEFACITYAAIWKNESSVQLSGCMYDTYNACEEIDQVESRSYMCKYCDTMDGCNAADRPAGLLVALLIGGTAAALTAICSV